MTRLPYNQTPDRLCAVGVLIFRSYNIENVLDKIGAARKQLPEDNCGLVYINFDTSYMIASHTGDYLEFLANRITDKLTPEENTRIGAIILTAGPHARVRVTDIDTTIVNPGMTVRIIRNPYSSLPSEFRLPMEPDPLRDDETIMNVENLF
jgi:hypothetical protein